MTKFKYLIREKDMPIIIPKELPASKVLSEENIFIMNKEKAANQDIRPLEILILNLMPTKIETETQLIRLLGNSPLQVRITLLKTCSYKSKNTSSEHLDSFYKTFDEIKDKKHDGLIITGAPIETLPFEEVEYWDELKEIMDYSNSNVTSTLHICWGAQAGLYYHHGVDKHPIGEKMFGVFKHERLNQTNQLLRGFDHSFYVPHSRYTMNKEEDILKVPDLEILAKSKESGVYLVATKDMKQVFATGHSEYAADTLAKEYFRDASTGVETPIPVNYFTEDNPEKGIEVTWRGHGHLLFSNWINYCVYQMTPYDLDSN